MKASLIAIVVAVVVILGAMAVYDWAAEKMAQRGCTLFVIGRVQYWECPGGTNGR